MSKSLFFFITFIFLANGFYFAQPMSAGSWENEFIGNRAGVPFFPDGNANYWTYTFKNKLKIGYKITGEAPYARYASFNLYSDKKRSSISSLLDNDFLSDKTHYDIYIVPKGYSDTPQENTLYYEKNGRSSSLFLRYYLPQVDIFGGVSLPEISAFDLETKKTIPLPHKRYNRLGKQRLLQIFLIYISKTIEKKYYKSASIEIRAIKVTGKGYYEDNHNSYLIIPLVREENSVAILRFKPPSYAKSRLDSSSDVRYWSLSQVNKKTYTLYTMHDEEFKIDDDGFVYIVIGDEIPSTQGVKYNYMKWNTRNKHEMLLLYRNLVSSHSFKFALENIPENAIAKTHIGDYAPSGLIISKEKFDNSGFTAIQNR